MKKTLAWLLTLFMVLTVSSVSVFAAETAVAEIGDVSYTSLAEAIAAVEEGDTLTIFEGTYDAALTITKSNVTVIGQGEVVLNGVPTLKGTNYKVENIDFNYTNGYNNLSGSGLIKNCTFTATENTFRYCYGAKDGAITFEGTTFNPADGYWAIHFDGASGTDLTFTDCEINGKVALASDLGSLTANNTEFNNAYVNVWGTEDGASFEDCEFNEVPYIFTGYDAENTVDFSDCTVVKDGNSASVGDIIYGGVDNADAKITNDGVLIAGGVAKIGQTQYATLADALAAAVDGDTVTLLWADGDAPIAMAGSVFGNKTITITGTATVDWSKGNLFVGRGGGGNGTVIFNNAILTSASNNASTGIHVSGREKDTDNKYDGTLVINNSTIELDYLINKGTMTLDNSTLTVKNGFSIGGRPATETESGEDATATLTLNNGSKVIVNNHNGMGLGYEAIGVMNINSGSTFECTQSFLVTEKGTMNVNGGTVKIDGTLTNNGTVAVTGETTLNINTLTGTEINLLDGAIIKDSTVGGEAMLYGKVTFRGDNTFAMLYDFGNAYSTEYAEWIVEKGASVTLTEKARYGLGYGDKVTIYGSLTDALSARETLTEGDVAVFMHGLVAMSNWNVENSLTVKDAYVVIGSNNSFGNSPKSGHTGTFEIVFDNAVLDASRITFYAAESKTNFSFVDSDVKVGTFMTRDADSVFTLTNTKLLSTTTTNGTDEGNYHAGTLTLNNSSLTYSAPLVMENGTLTVGAGSTLTAPSITGTGKIVIDTTGMIAGEVTIIAGDLSGFTGTVEVVGDESLSAYIEDGKIYLKNVVAKIGDIYYETLADAMAAVGAGDVVIELLDDATLSYPARSAFGTADTTSITINGNGHTLTLHQTDTDWSSIGMANANGKLVLNNMTINKTSAGGNGAWNNHAINFHCDVEMNNVTVNNSVAVHADAVLNNVDIVENGGYYGLWITADGQSVTMNGGSITATNGGRGIKIGDQYVDDVASVNLNVTGTTFTTAKKAAILVTSTEGAMITVNNIDISGVAQDTIHAVWMDEDRGEHFDKVTVVGGKVLQEGEFTCIVLKNEDVFGYYKTLEAAFAAASTGDTVLLLDDVNAPVAYAVNKTLTLDLNGKKIASGADVALTATAGKLTIVDSSEAKTGEIIGTQKAIHSSAYVAIQSGKFTGTITTANGQADDSQVCITGGTFTVEPAAGIVEHCYHAEANGDGTYTVVDTLYTVTLGNGGTNAGGAGEYICGQTVYLYAGTKTGYQFAGWLSSDIEIVNGGNTTISFVMPDHDVTVTAYWATGSAPVPVVPVITGTLNFETNGGTAIASITRAYGMKVALADFVTTREGYTFAGWYSDAELTKPVSQITLNGRKTVYAGWIETPVIPDVPVVTLPLTDVATDSYYYNAVLWAVSAGITNGTSDTTFSPDVACTRAQVVTFLWRAAGSPVAQSDDMPFTDVSRDAYYYDAVLWAVEQGITNGVSATEFAPDAECTRGQIVTFLWRSQGSPEAAADSGFSDVEADAYYATAVEWAVDNGITNGIGDNTFGADAECTRGQTVTFLYRHFCK